MTIKQMRFEISSLPMALRTLGAGEKLGRVIVEAGQEFTQATGREAQMAFVKEIPAGVEEGQEVKGIMLIRADWVEPGQVAVGAGGTEVIDEEMRVWRKK